MGFFSWDCVECGHPALSPKAVNNNKINLWMTQVVVHHDRHVYRGEYDGYGEVVGALGGLDLVDLDGEACLRHQACWEVQGKPGYSKPSRSSADQGFFFEDPDHAMARPQTPEDIQVGRELAEQSRERTQQAWKQALKGSGSND